MVKVICLAFLVVFGSAMVKAQTTNFTIVAIEGLKIQALVALTPPYNLLKNELDGHFFRSSTAIRLARSTLFATASTFPYFSLTNDTKSDLKSNLTYILNNCMDPTIDYLQNQASNTFFSFSNDTKSPIEQALQPGFDQLNTLEDAIRSADNQTCLAAINVNTLNLTATYLNFTNGIETCTANASASYRGPITSFVEKNFVALPVLTAMNLNLAGCMILPFNEACVKLFLATYSDSCNSITAIKDQAQAMVDTNQAAYEACLKKTKDLLPSSVPYLTEVNACKTAIA